VTDSTGWDDAYDPAAGALAAGVPPAHLDEAASAGLDPGDYLWAVRGGADHTDIIARGPGEAVDPRALYGKRWELSRRAQAQDAALGDTNPRLVPWASPDWELELLAAGAQLEQLRERDQETLRLLPFFLWRRRVPPGEQVWVRADGLLVLGDEMVSLRTGEAVAAIPLRQNWWRDVVHPGHPPAPDGQGWAETCARMHDGLLYVGRCIGATEEETGGSPMWADQVAAVEVRVSDPLTGRVVAAFREELGPGSYPWLNGSDWYHWLTTRDDHLTPMVNASESGPLRWWLGVFEPRTGQYRWRHRWRGGPPTAAHPNPLIALDPLMGRVRAVVPATGEVCWESSFSEGGELRAAGASHSHVVLACYGLRAERTTVRVYTLGDGELAWQERLPGHAAVAYRNGTVVTQNGARVEGRSLTDGGRRWAMRAPSQLRLVTTPPLGEQKLAWLRGDNGDSLFVEAEHGRHMLTVAGAFYHGADDWMISRCGDTVTCIDLHGERH
jgi:hypothetical protein